MHLPNQGLTSLYYERGGRARIKLGGHQKGSFGRERREMLKTGGKGRAGRGNNMQEAESRE
jgi:hypothetical protein